MDVDYPKRKHVRLKNYDYSRNGIYFVTICTQNRRCILSQIVLPRVVGAEMIGRGLAPAAPRLTVCGRLVEEELTALMVRYPSVWIEKYVIMPNHIHALIYLQEDTAVEWLDNLGQSFGNPDTMTTSSGTTTFFEPLDLHRPKLRQMDRRRVLPGRTGEMAMKDQKKRTILSVVGMVALLIVCVVGVQGICRPGDGKRPAGGCLILQSERPGGRRWKPDGSESGGFFRTGGYRF